MGAVHTFQSDFEAIQYARTHKPFRAALTLNDASYERRHGRALANCADACRLAAAANDLRSLHLRTIQMSVLMRERERAQYREREAA